MSRVFIVLFFREKNQKNLNEVLLLGAPQESFDQTFSKVCRVPSAKRRSLAHERNSPFGVFFLVAFSFAPFESKEKADKRSDVVFVERYFGRTQFAPTELI